MIALVLSIFALVIVSIITIVLFVWVNKSKKELELKLLDIVGQVNNSSTYAYKFDISQDENIKNLDNNIVLLNESLDNIMNNVKSIERRLEQSPQLSNSGIRFTHDVSSQKDKYPLNSEISNDTKSFKKLMLVGNMSNGKSRTVGVMDTLDVHGEMNILGGAYDVGCLNAKVEGEKGNYYSSVQAMDTMNGFNTSRPIRLNPKGGNVAVGNIDPKSKLHVVGDIRVENGQLCFGSENNSVCLTQDQLVKIKRMANV